MSFHSIKNRGLFLLFTCFFAAPQVESQAQSAAERFSLRIGTRLNLTNASDDPMALSVHVEPRLRLKQKISLGLRYDIGVHGFGNQRLGENNNIYWVADADLSLLRSAALLGYFHFKVLMADFQLGLGAEYAHTAARTIQYYSKLDKELLGVEITEVQNKLALAMAFSVNLGRSYFTIKLGKFNRGSNATISDNYMSLALGQCILADQTGWDNTPRAERIPSVFLEFGVNAMLPIFADSRAGALGAFLEPKFAVSRRSSIGFHYDFERGQNKGLDTDLAVQTGSNSSGELQLRRLNRMSYTHAMLFTYDYYFPATGGWYFMGGGVGQYKQDKMQDIGRGFFSNNNLNFPILPTEQNFGGMLRVGMKTSLVRIALSYNFSGKGISDYIGFQMGFEPSFLREE